MSVDPVDDRVVDLIFDRLVNGLVHQAFPLDDLLVFRANGVVPVDVEVRGDDAGSVQTPFASGFLNWMKASAAFEGKWMALG